MMERREGGEGGQRNERVKEKTGERKCKVQ